MHLTSFLLSCSIICPSLEGKPKYFHTGLVLASKGILFVDIKSQQLQKSYYKNCLQKAVIIWFTGGNNLYNVVCVHSAHAQNNMWILPYHACTIVVTVNIPIVILSPSPIRRVDNNYNRLLCFMNEKISHCY